MPTKGKFHQKLIAHFFHRPQLVVEGMDRMVSPSAIKQQYGIMNETTGQINPIITRVDSIAPHSAGRLLT